MMLAALVLALLPPSPVLAIFRYPWHASCRVQWTFSSSCSQVSSRLSTQMAAWEGDTLCPSTSPSCPDLPCGQNCLYSLVSSTAGELTAEHRTPVARYVDDLTFTLREAGEGCRVDGYSTSRTWYAVLDQGTNYCNLRNLLDGAGLSAENGFTEATSNKKCTQYDVRDCSRF